MKITKNHKGIARLFLTIFCMCGHAFYYNMKGNGFIHCLNPECELFDVKFKIPEFDLELYEEGKD
jgi:hypothetical protein